MAFYSPVASQINGATLQFRAYNETSISVKYRDSSGVNQSSTIAVADKLRLDLSSGYDEQILTGSARFKVGADTFLDRDGILYRNVNPSNNSGIASGSIQYGTGKVEIESWTPHADNTSNLDSLTITTDMPTMNQVSIKTPVIPIPRQSLTVVVA